MIELVRFRGRERRINIPQEIGVHYQEFGYLLLDDGTGARVSNIIHFHRENPEKINMDVLQQWLSGKGIQPVTWSSLVQVLRDIDLVDLAEDIADVKTC